MSPGRRYCSHSHGSISWSQLTGHFVHTLLSSSHCVSSATCSKFVVDQPDRICTNQCIGVYLCPCGTQHSRDGSAYATSTACDDAHGRFHCTYEHSSEHCSDLQGHAKTARVYVREEVDRNTCSLRRRLLSLDSGSTDDVQRPCRTYGCL